MIFKIEGSLHRAEVILKQICYYFNIFSFTCILSEEFFTTVTFYKLLYYTK